jgi:hypothetical protein
LCGTFGAPATTLLILGATITTDVWAANASPYRGPTIRYDTRGQNPNSGWGGETGFGYFKDWEGAAARVEHIMLTRSHYLQTPGLPFATEVIQLPDSYVPLADRDKNSDGIRDRWYFINNFLTEYPIAGGCPNKAMSAWNGGSTSVQIREPVPPSPAPGLASLRSTLSIQNISPSNCNGTSTERLASPKYSVELHNGAICRDAGSPDDISLVSGMCQHNGGYIRERNLGKQCPALLNGSNPINTATGNKYQEELDYPGTEHGFLRFVRYYNSQLNS